MTPDREAGGVLVEMRLSQRRSLLRELTMRSKPSRILDLKGDGELHVDGDVITWLPPEGGGTLSWFAVLQQLRGGASYDAYIGADWALFRAEDVIPRAATRTLRGATSDTSLDFRLPRGWSSVTEYYGKDDHYRIRKPGRRFDQPSGWVVLGELGVRNEDIDGVRVKIAAPQGQSVRHMDMIALLHWTLPDYRRLLPTFPHRLTVVSAGDPMWRGALSAPQSLYVHADRPLLSENSTSTLLHELFHVGFGAAAGENADWIVEGLAEYYGLQMLARTGTISSERLRKALAAQARWGKRAATLCTPMSTGANTARAVTLFAELDKEIRESTKNRRTLDDVTADLARLDAPVTLQALRDTVAAVTGKSASTLATGKLPGCA
ncbi:MAG: hypothetical protein ACREQZ_08735 [Woeseiaceae bacterium]